MYFPCLASAHGLSDGLAGAAEEEGGGAGDAGAGAAWSRMSIASDDGKLTSSMLSSSHLVLIEHLCHRAPERAQARAMVVGVRCRPMEEAGFALITS